VKHRATPKFWRHYQSLPPETRALADHSFTLLKNDPHHPSLHFKKVGRFWSARVGLFHRALAVEHSPDLVWFWIGRHNNYERLIRG
jgi:hypothetical protein